MADNLRHVRHLQYKQAQGRRDDGKNTRRKTA
jgi:hypothetical protein